MAFQCLYLQLLQARVWICLFHKKISAFLVFTEIIFAVRNPLDCFCSSTELTAQKHTLQVTSTARLNWTASDHPFHHDQRAPPHACALRPRCRSRLPAPPLCGQTTNSPPPYPAGADCACAASSPSCFLLRSWRGGTSCHLPWIPLVAQRAGAGARASLCPPPPVRGRSYFAVG